VAIDYREAILNARVYDVAIESPLDEAPALSVRLRNRLLLKREDLQPVFSFKLRGACNKVSRLPGAASRRGVIAASAGNHGQGVALAAQELGIPATIVMPITTPRIKIDAVAARGAEFVLEGDSYDEAYAAAQRIARRRRLTFVHPYDDPDVIAGQGPSDSRSCAGAASRSTRSSSRSAAAGWSAASRPASSGCGSKYESSASSPSTRTRCSAR
jgi:threonine dehydratase